MKNYTADDFICADITVERIVDVSYSASPNWARDTKTPRHCEGIMYFLSGNIEYEFGDCVFRAYPGCVLKLPTGTPYKGKKLDSSSVDIYLIDFTCQEGSFDDFPIPYSFTPTDPDGVLREFKEILDMYRKHSVCSYLECKNAVSRLLCNLAKDVAVNKCHYGEENRIMRMCEYIRENCVDNAFRVADMADRFHISEAHMRRIFASEIRISPAAFLMNARLDLAKNRLARDVEASIGEIAFSCGFSSVYYFSSAFKQRVGCTPSEYRARFCGQEG